jgi:hypothetical protein
MTLRTGAGALTDAPARHERVAAFAADGGLIEHGRPLGGSETLIARLPELCSRPRHLASGIAS